MRVRNRYIAGAAGMIGVCALAAATLVPQDAPPEGAQPPPPEPPEHLPVSFSRHVRPILENHCIECHGNGKSKGDFSIDTRATMLEHDEAVIPGDSSNSLLIELVSSDNPDDAMPQEGEPLTSGQIAVLELWIDQGAVWDEGFTFLDEAYVAPLRPRRVELPPGRDGVTHPIDRILDAYSEANETTVSGVIDDSAFMRRVSLDVVGLLPGVDELGVFIADDDPEKRSRLVERLLADDRGYTEHWLTFWNDLLRNDYAGTGYIDGGRSPITQWLYESLYTNKPYDRFVSELVNPTPASQGFAAGITWRGNVSASQGRELQYARSVSQVFLGVTLKCASCHDSFVDDWKLADAYGMAAIYADRELEMHRCDKPTGEFARAAFLFPELGAVDPDAPRVERLRQFAALMTSRENGRLTRTIVNRIWARLMGRGIVEPVDAMANPPWSADLLDYLAVHLADGGYDLKQTIALIVTSRAYQSESVAAVEPKAGSPFLFRGPLPKRMTAEQFIDAVWSVTGAGPTQANAKVAVPGADDGDAAEIGDHFVRASMVVSNPLMRSLGRPNREQIVSGRPAELSTLRALDLINGAVMADQLRRGAAGLAADDRFVDDDLVDHLYLRLLSRLPTITERELAAQLLDADDRTQGIEDLLWAMFMLPEFQLIR